MRLLHMDSGREMRGGQWQALRLAQGLAAAGEEVLLLAPAGSPLYVKANDLNLDVRPLRPMAVAQLARTADLVHAHDARSHTLAALLAPWRPLVVARRVAFPIRSRWKYRRAAHYIAVSSFVRNMLVAGGVPSARISVVYDGVPLAPAAPARNAHRLAWPGRPAEGTPAGGGSGLPGGRAGAASPSISKRTSKARRCSSTSPRPRDWDRPC